jgi:PmbA protein
MNQLSFSEAKNFLLERARAKQASIEVYGSKNSSTSVQTYEGKVSEFKLAQRNGIGVRALVQGSWGYSYTENLAQPALERCLDAALENAALVAPEAHASLKAHAEPPHLGDLYGEGLSGVTVDRKVKAAIELEQAARNADPRVKSVPYMAYQDGESEIMVANTAGLDRAYKSNFAAQYLAPLVSEGEQNKMQFGFEFTREFEQLDPTRTALEAVRKSVAMLGASQPKSGKYPVVIANECMGLLLGTFEGIFSAKMVQEGKSPIKGKLGETLASSLVTIIDDATYHNGPDSRPFDSEGYPSKPLTLLEHGVLRSYLHNTETAAKDGVESTGHASRWGYRGIVGIGSSNWYLEAGKDTKDTLVSSINEGVLLTGLHGTHAGANMITGEFSLQADGFWVEDGKIARPLENFTVAGNVLEVLRDIEALGDDFKFGMWGAGSPSVRVRELNIGGL